jgi:hypothetical protein
MALFQKREAYRDARPLRSQPFPETGLTFDPVNPNKGTKRGLDLLETSIERYGAGRSAVSTGDDVIIAGNKSAQVAAEKGIPFRVIETDGTEFVVVKRRDLQSGDPRAKELAIADNRTSEVGVEWDGVILDAYRVDGSVDLGAFFFDEEIDRILGNKADKKHVSFDARDGKLTCPKCGFSFEKSDPA